MSVIDEVRDEWKEMSESDQQKWKVRAWVRVSVYTLYLPCTALSLSILFPTPHTAHRQTGSTSKVAVNEARRMLCCAVLC